jgi:hypothetical protein
MDHAVDLVQLCPAAVRSAGFADGRFIGHTRSAASPSLSSGLRASELVRQLRGLLQPVKIRARRAGGSAARASTAATEQKRWRRVWRRCGRRSRSRALLRGHRRPDHVVLLGDADARDSGRLRMDCMAAPASPAMARADPRQLVSTIDLKWPRRTGVRLSRADGCGLRLRPAGLAAGRGPTLAPQLAEQEHALRDGPALKDSKQTHGMTGTPDAIPRQLDRCRTLSGMRTHNQAERNGTTSEQDPGSEPPDGQACQRSHSTGPSFTLAG